MTSRPRLAQAYLVLQALAIATWWLWLCSSAQARERFRFAGWPEETLLVFAAPDLVLLVFGSAIAARGVARNSHWQKAAMWLVAGAASYATVFCVTASMMTHSMWQGSAMMLLCMAGSLTIAWWHKPAPPA